MTPIAFNDGIEFANRTSAAVGSTTYTFDQRHRRVLLVRAAGAAIRPARRPTLPSDGFRIINTTGDFYYVLGKNDSFDSGYTYASNWSNYKVCGTTPERVLRHRRHVLHVERLPRRGDADAGGHEDPPAAARHGPCHGRQPTPPRMDTVRCPRRLQRRRHHQHRSSRAGATTISQTAAHGRDLHGGGQRHLYLHRLRRQLHRDRFPRSATTMRPRTTTGDTIYTCTRCGEQLQRAAAARVCQHEGR